MIAFDMEAGGLDQFHGVRPFFLSVCGPDGPAHREWAVDPLTRQVQVDPNDVEWIRKVIRDADRVVGHNIAFDCRGLEHLGVLPPWDRVEDTMVASHVLFSAPPHNLTHVAGIYLDEDINRYEAGLEKAVKKCRSMVQQARLKEGRGKTPVDELSPLRHWRIAEEGDPGLPSSTGADVWRSDYWLPRAMYNSDPHHPDYAGYATVLRDYALVDAVTTYHLWAKLERLLRERGLWNVYRAKMAVVPAAYRMERRGMTVDRTVLRDAQEKYGVEADDAAELLVGIAKSYGYDLQLPKGATNHNLDDFIFGRGQRPDGGKRDAKLPRVHARDTLNLPVVLTTESGAPSFGGDARDVWLGETLQKGTKPYLFIETLARRSELDTGVGYLNNYERFLLPVGDDDEKGTNPDREEVLVEGRKDQNVLELDGVPQPWRVRTVQSGGRRDGSSGVVHPPRRKDTGGEDHNAHLRQPQVCESETSETGDLRRKQCGHDTEGSSGERRQERLPIPTGKTPTRVKPPEQSGYRGTGTGDATTVQGRGDNLQEVGGVVRTQQTPSTPDRHQKSMETRRVERFVIHPSFKICGTQTTRLSSNNPNAQNISKQSSVNLRKCFVPRPGYELYSFDAAGIELIIPAKLADETEVLDVMLNPDRGPYFGSYHLLIFDTLHPELFAKHGKACKQLFEDTWYQWCKNGSFARQYGAQERKVDATYRVPGAYRKIAARFPKIDALNRAVIAGANRDGCVFTVPDREVDVDHGYQIVCRRNARDTIPPTVPFAYFVSGTAGWWMNRAIAKVDQLVEGWRRDEGFDAHTVATVHDELVVELPARDGNGNVERVRTIRKTMESCGTVMGIPTPVKSERHRETWAVGEEVI